MRHENLAIENVRPAWIPYSMPRAVNIETPGYYGSGFISLPIRESIRDQWPSREVAKKLVLEEVAQVMGAVLASDIHDPLSAKELGEMLREFEEVEFKSPLDPSRKVQIVVRIQTRYGAMARGIFVAFQNAHLIAAGKLVMRGHKLP